VLDLIQAQPGLFARQGRVVATWRRRGPRKLGPYYELRFRQSGRCRGIYLGRDGPRVQQVRDLLDQLQQPRRRLRHYRQFRRRVRAAIGTHKTHLDTRLQSVGLRLQGFEVRGWRAWARGRLTGG